MIHKCQTNKAVLSDNFDKKKNSFCCKDVHDNNKLLLITDVRIALVISKYNNYILSIPKKDENAERIER